MSNQLLARFHSPPLRLRPPERRGWPLDLVRGITIAAMILVNNPGRRALRMLARALVPVERLDANRSHLHLRETARPVHINRPPAGEKGG
jgi:hypothetical protein